MAQAREYSTLMLIASANDVTNAVGACRWHLIRAYSSHQSSVRATEKKWESSEDCLSEASPAAPIFLSSTGDRWHRQRTLAQRPAFFAYFFLLLKKSKAPRGERAQTTLLGKKTSHQPNSKVHSMAKGRMEARVATRDPKSKGSSDNV